MISENIILKNRILAGFLMEMVRYAKECGMLICSHVDEEGKRWLPPKCVLLEAV